MREKAYTLTATDGKLVERIIEDGNIHYIHAVLEAGGGLPEHNTNAPVYMTVLRGEMVLCLGDGEGRRYGPGSVLAIPHGARMRADNGGQGPLEITVVKAPAP